MSARTARKAPTLADDSELARRRAAALLDVTDAEWTEWEIQFLDALVARASPEPLSERQREKLAELHKTADLFRTIDGLTIRTLISACFENRFDLDEDDIAFIERLHRDKPAHLRRRPAHRLLALARALDLAPRYAA